MAKIVDPDSLNQSTDDGAGIPDGEVFIDTTAKTIELIPDPTYAGNLYNTSPASTSGVTLQAVYSFLKEEWKTDTDLNKFKFPIKMFTKTDGIMINGWSWANSTTRSVIRDGGWEEVSGDKYASIVSLGNFDATSDQANYQNVVGYDQSTINFGHTGNLNEAIMIYNATGPVDYTGYLKLFLRIANGGAGTGKLYSEYNLLTEQTISALEPVLYKLPLSNSTDLKINTLDTAYSSGIYTGMKINYLKGTLFATAAVQSYVTGNVVKDGVGRWAYCTTGGTLTGGQAGPYASFTGTAIWEAYDGEVQIGTTYYAFNRLITGNGGTAQEIYNWAQYKLRQTSDINSNDSPTTGQRLGTTVKGNVAELLLEYVGDTLKTKPGLYIAGFDTNSTNSIKFRDITVDGGGVNANTYLPLTSTERAYPFVAAGNINFSANLVSEPDGDTIYTMYFNNAGGNEFDTANAIIVNNNSGTPITGQITSSQIAFDFDYDNNVQGGRTGGTDAAVWVVAQGLNGATWVAASYTITRATGQSVTVNADDERNYSNPV